MRIVTIPGALRKDSYNRKLLALAIDKLRQHDVDIVELDLRDFPLPLYDGDLEESEGHPENARKLQEIVGNADGIVIASPEYNGGISGMLKNMIDWTSRGGVNPYAGKVVGLMGATTGQWGTHRGMPQLRQVMNALMADVIPQQMNVPKAANAWDEQGKLIDEKLGERVAKFVGLFLKHAQVISD